MKDQSITYQIGRYPMRKTGVDDFGLWQEHESNGQPWEFIDVSVTKYIDGDLVDEVDAVDDLPTVAASESAIKRFQILYPNAYFEDLLT